MGYKSGNYNTQLNLFSVRSARFGARAKLVVIFNFEQFASTNKGRVSDIFLQSDCVNDFNRSLGRFIVVFSSLPNLIVIKA